MSIRTDQLTPDNAAAQFGETIYPTPAQGITLGILAMRQLRSRMIFLGVSTYARTYTATIALGVGYVPVGTTVAAVTLEIAATTDRFKIGAAVIGLSSTLDTNTGLATIVHKAITDNLEFSSAYTVNAGLATGRFWGAFRIQMNSAGTVSTRAYAADQVFVTETEATTNCPAAAAGMINLGTITVRSATDVIFTANTTALTGGGITVNFNGAASGFTLVTTATLAPVAATLVQGTMTTSKVTRTTPHTGALLVARYTSDGSFAATDLSVNVSYRPFPLNNEAA
jgi:hypothetical protein